MEKHINEFVAHCQKIIDDAELFGNPSLSVRYGKRYARIFKSSLVGNDGVVYGFIDLQNGDILKAASCKAPIKNFARGNVNDPNTWNFNHLSIS